MTRTAYLHIPFCRSKCLYCDFYSSPGADEARLDAYTRALLLQIGTAERAALSSVYFGGGTPAVLGTRRLTALLDALAARFSIDTDAEVTLELNPNSLGCADLAALRTAGFNRLSIGLQSALPQGLAALGRTHTAEDFLRCVDSARKAGFSNLSADMIFAVPGLSADENLATAAFLADCGLEHISAYELSYEAGTPLTRALEAGRITAPGDEEAGELYTRICALLRGRGYAHYEISNFAKPGYPSRHNLHYWACGEYYAFGAAAHGYLNGKRFSVVRDTDAYIARTRGAHFWEACDDLPALPLSAEEREEERRPSRVEPPRRSGGWVGKLSLVLAVVALAVACLALYRTLPPGEDDPQEPGERAESPTISYRDRELPVLEGVAVNSYVSDGFSVNDRGWLTYEQDGN